MVLFAFRDRSAMFPPEHLTIEQSVFKERSMAETATAGTQHGHSEISAEMFRVAEAVERAMQQVTDVLLKVRRDYPEWNLPSEVVQGGTA